MSKQVPYKTFLRRRFSLGTMSADMKTDHRPIINPATGKPNAVRPRARILYRIGKAELNNTDALFHSDEILSFYKCIALHLWSELFLRKALTPGKDLL